MIDPASVLPPGSRVAGGPVVAAPAKRWSLVALTALAAYAAFFYRDLLFENRIYVFRDMYTLFFAIEHTARTLARWHWPPLWDPFASLGRPFAADLVTAVYYPPNWGLRRLPEAQGVNLSIALHHFIAAAGVFVLLRRHHLAVTSATLGALGFGFGGMMVSFDNMLNGLRSAAWLPWTVVAFEFGCTRRSPAAVAALAVTLGMAALGGMPEFVLFADALLVAVAAERARSGAGPRLLRSLAMLAMGNVIALGLYAVELVPFAEYLLHSSRLAGLRATGVTGYSLHPLGVLAFLVPRCHLDGEGEFHDIAALWDGAVSAPPWALTLYLGVILVLLVPMLARLSRDQRRWWGGIGLAALILAFGKYLPGYVWLVEHVPLLRVMRYPEKFLLLTHALLAVGIALGWESIVREPACGRAAAAAAALCAVAALVAHRLMATATTWPALPLADDLLLLVPLFAVVAVLVVAARTRPRAAGLAMVLLAAIDLYRVNGRLLPTVPAAAVQRVPRTLEAMQRGDDPLRIYSDGVGRPAVPAFPDTLIQEQNLLLMNDASYYLIGNLNDPASVLLNDHELLEELIESLPRDRLAPVFAALNVPYVTSPKDLHYPGLRMVQSPRNPLEVYVFEVEPRTARAFVPARLHPVSTPTEAIAYLRHGGDPSTEVAVEARSVPRGLPASIDGTVRMVSYLPERIELRARMRTPGLVVLADTYYLGWEASVDGALTPIVRANHFVRGVYVDAGEHRVVFRFAPLSYRVGATISGLTCGSLLLAVAWTARRGRRT